MNYDKYIMHSKYKCDQHSGTPGMLTLKSILVQVTYFHSVSGPYMLFQNGGDKSKLFGIQGLKKLIVGFRLPTDPCRCLRLIQFYACQKYKIKYCRPSVVEGLGYSKTICNLLTRKRVRL